MATVAREQTFNGSLELSDTYDPTKITVTGNLVRQMSLSANPEDKYLGPPPGQVIRAVELSGWLPNAMQVIRYGNKHYIFSGDSAAAGATRRVAAFTYDLVTGATSYLGFITLNFPTTTAHTLRGLRASMQFYTEGTVAVSGTAVTGTGTQWTTSGLTAGSRIGFGSTNSHDPIIAWHEIQSVNSDTSITLTASAGTITAGTPYVIEDLRMYVSTSNATVANGGVFVVKGLRIDIFGAGGTGIVAATTIDNIRAVYRLKDAATILNNAPGGLALGAGFVDWQTEYIYVPDGYASNLRVFRYNVRAPLSHTTGDGAVLTAGTDVVTTGIQVVTGVIQGLNNGRIVTAGHGPGNGETSLYLTTTTRILRAPVANIAQGSVSFIADQMIEVPVGGGAGFPITNTLSVAEYSPKLDRFLFCGFAAGNGRIYVSDYRSDGGQVENQFGILHQSYDQSLANNPPFPKIFAATQLWAEDGVLYLTSFGGTAVPTGQIYVYPGFGVHWDYAAASGERAILPVMNLGSSVTRFRRVYANAVQYIKTLNALLKQCEPFRLLYRTAGIDDNSGAWTIVDQTGDLSGLDPSSQIQFAVEFHSLGDIPIAPRLSSLAVVYDTEEAIPAEFQWNFGDSNVVDGTFGFIQTDLLSSWPATFTIKMYRADNNQLVLDQASTGTTTGVFQYWDGDEWVAGVGSNTVNTRRRFVPSSSLPGGVDLYATLKVV
jgi:hypothetical protein